MNAQSPALTGFAAFAAGAATGPVSALPKTDPRFPAIDPAQLPPPLGHKLLVQHAKVSETYAGTSIIKHVDQQEAEAYQCTEAKVLAIGGDAWCNRETGVPWKGGARVRVGDVILIPFTKDLRINRGGCTLQIIDDTRPLALLERPEA